jgi:hypothetical protein
MEKLLRSAEGATIFKKGEGADQLYFIETGRIAIRVRTHNQNMTVAARAIADSNIFGGGVRTMRTSLRFDLNPRPSQQAAGATQREQRYGSA